MNSFNVLREFKDIISKSFISNLDQDIDRVLKECMEIIDKDIVIIRHYSQNWSKLKKLIATWNKDKSDKKENKKLQNMELSSYRLMIYYFDKFLNELDNNYKQLTYDELKSELSTTKDLDNIYALTSSLISKLLDEGFTLDNLYSMSRFILIDNHMMPRPTFERNLAYIGDLINKPPVEWQIIYRLEGFADLSLIPESISGIEFKPEVDIKTGNSSINKFLMPGARTLFAISTIKSQDSRAAGYETKKILEDILDLIRFEFEYELVSISSEFYSVSKEKLFKLNDNIPNPIGGVDSEYFKIFVQFVMNYLSDDTNPRDLKEKIRSTLRFYRMGRDSNRVENKFLNWWTTLEHLVRTGGGNKIYEHTEEQTIPVIVLNYIPKLLRSYRDSLDFCDVLPREETSLSQGVRKYTELSLRQFFDCLHDPDEMSHIKLKLVEYPVLAHSIEKFSKNISTAKDILHFMNSHETHLKWHLNRIWRARCDLVHSAETTISINLLCANLEFYLKSIFSHIANFLMIEPNIPSMLELYDLINHKHAEILFELSENKTDALCESLDSKCIGAG